MTLLEGMPTSSLRSASVAHQDRYAPLSEGSSASDGAERTRPGVTLSSRSSSSAKNGATLRLFIHHPLFIRRGKLGTRLLAAFRLLDLVSTMPASARLARSADRSPTYAANL